MRRPKPLSGRTSHQCWWLQASPPVPELPLRAAEAPPRSRSHPSRAVRSPQPQRGSPEGQTGRCPKEVSTEITDKDGNASPRVGSGLSPSGACWPGRSWGAGQGRRQGWAPGVGGGAWNAVEFSKFPRDPAWLPRHPKTRVQAGA